MQKDVTFPAKAWSHLGILPGLAALAIGLTSLDAQVPDGDSTSWIGQADGQWEEGSNWDFGQAPNGVGQGAMLGIAGFGEESGTRTITLAADVTLSRLTFGGTLGAILPDGTPGYRNYLLLGPGNLVLDGGDGAISELTAYTTGAGNAHQIDANVKIASPLEVTIGDAGRELIIAGQITGQGDSPVDLNVKGTALNGSLRLLGENQFAGGKIEITSNNVLDLGSAGAAGAATICLSQEGEGGLRLSAVSPKDLTFNYKLLDVQENGTLFVERREMDIVQGDSGNGDSWAWGSDPYTGIIRIPSIQIAPGRTLSVLHRFHNQNLIVSGGSEIQLGAGSGLRVESRQPNRGINMRIADGGMLRGDGFVTTFTAGESALTTKLFIERDGIVSPGTAEAPGRLNFGESAEEARSILVEAGPESKFRFRVNRAEPGKGYDQIVVNGSLHLDEAELELSSTGEIRTTDVVFLIVTASGEGVTGAFDGAADGDTVSIAGPGGKVIKARISYGANAAKGSTSGGHDVALHSFR